MFQHVSLIQLHALPRPLSHEAALRPMPSGSQHADFYVDLASFELLGFEYPSATIAAASLLCGLWNMKEESLEQPKRLSQVVQLLGSQEGSHLLGSKPGVVVEADLSLIHI